jgi:hypothetical protein
VNNNNDNEGTKNGNRRSSVPALPTIKASQTGRAAFLNTLLDEDDAILEDNAEQQEAGIEHKECANFDLSRNSSSPVNANNGGGDNNNDKYNNNYNRSNSSNNDDENKSSRRNRRLSGLDDQRLSSPPSATTLQMQQTPRRNSQRYISATVHIISDLDVKRVQDKEANNKDMFDTSSSNFSQLPQDKAYVGSGDSNTVISPSRSLAEDNVRKSSAHNQQTTTSADKNKASKVTDTSCPTSTSQDPLTANSRPQNDRPSVGYVTKSSEKDRTVTNHTAKAADDRQLTINQWTTCRALENAYDDDDDEEEEEDDLHDVYENGSNLYYADDEAASRSRTSSMSSVGGVWLHDQAAIGRISRMTSMSNLVGGGGRKKRPLLLPPIMLPPIYATIPTPLVLRDDVYFATAGSANRCRPISDKEWDSLWDCRYLRIPNRAKRSIRV